MRRDVGIGTRPGRRDLRQQTDASLSGHSPLLGGVRNVLSQRERERERERGGGGERERGEREGEREGEERE